MSNPERPTDRPPGKPPRKPADLAQRYAAQRERTGRGRVTQSWDRDGWRRETFTLPRSEAREKAREFFDRWPKAAYMTEVEFWQELADGSIEFTMRRLPTAD